MHREIQTIKFLQITRAEVRISGLMSLFFDAQFRHKPKWKQLIERSERHTAT